MIKCDCDERIGVDIRRYDQFEELKEFFDSQVKKGVFKDVKVKKPYFIGKDDTGVAYWYPDKWYKCKVCGTLWIFEYPDFPAIGRVTKVPSGIAPEPETNY